MTLCSLVLSVGSVSFFRSLEDLSFLCPESFLVVTWIVLVASNGLLLSYYRSFGTHLQIKVSVDLIVNSRPHFISVNI